MERVEQTFSAFSIFPNLIHYLPGTLCHPPNFPVCLIVSLSLHSKILKLYPKIVRDNSDKCLRDHLTKGIYPTNVL